MGAGLLITQRSRVQIPPPLLVSAGQGPFPLGEGLLRIGHRPADAVGRAPAGFDCVPELRQTWSKLLENVVAGQSRSLLDRGDPDLDGFYLGDERLDPLWRPDIAREVVPSWVKLGRHTSVLPAAPAFRCRVEPYWIKAAPPAPLARRQRRAQPWGGPPGARRATHPQAPRS